MGKLLCDGRDFQGGLRGKREKKRKCMSERGKSKPRAFFQSLEICLGV